MNMYQKIQAAEKRIRPYIYETLLEQSLFLSNQLNVNILLKLEHLQKTGSFKFRGAINKILLLSEKEKFKGIIAASTGNHGQAVALAANTLGINATIYIPSSASSMKLNLIKALGAKIEICEGDCLQAELQARQVAKENDLTFISPYNDYDIIAGQGTIGVELLRQYKTLDAVFITVGGGGLISGIASYLKQLNPNIQIIGCWPENSPIMYECIKAGKIFDVSEIKTISDATMGGIEKNSVTFSLCQNLIDKYVLVSEHEIISAMRLLGDYERTIVEGAAGVALASLIKTADVFKKKTVAVILCGRNISFDQLKEITK